MTVFWRLSNIGEKTALLRLNEPDQAQTYRIVDNAYGDGVCRCMRPG